MRLLDFTACVEINCEQLCAKRKKVNMCFQSQQQEPINKQSHTYIKLMYSQTSKVLYWSFWVLHALLEEASKLSLSFTGRNLLCLYSPRYCDNSLGVWNIGLKAGTVLSLLLIIKFIVSSAITLSRYRRYGARATNHLALLMLVMRAIYSAMMFWSNWSNWSNWSHWSNTGVKVCFTMLSLLYQRKQLA